MKEMSNKKDPFSAILSKKIILILVLKFSLKNRICGAGVEAGLANFLEKVEAGQ
jgi:hypothetical protein